MGTMSTQRRDCPRCGGSVQQERWATGAVWTCRDHGVVDWFFKDQTHVDVGPLPLR